MQPTDKNRASDSKTAATTNQITASSVTNNTADTNAEPNTDTDTSASTHSPPDLAEIRETANLPSLTRIKQTSLPEPVNSLAAEYDIVIGLRDEFLWKWVYTMVPRFRLSCVPDSQHLNTRIDKTLIAMLDTIIDDFGERDGYQDTFRTVKRVPFTDTTHDAEQASGDTDYIQFTERVWNTLHTRLKQTPRYDDYKSLFRFDFQNTVRSIEYSGLLNASPSLSNCTELMMYTPYNMCMLPMADIDLMHSPAFNDDDLSTLREVITEAQKLARIGDWVTTWEREVDEGDFSAGVFTCAIDNDVLSTQEIRDAKKHSNTAAKNAVKQKIKTAEIEDELLVEWETRHHALKATQYGVDSVNLTEYVASMRDILGFQLTSRGHK